MSTDYLDQEPASLLRAAQSAWAAGDIEDGDRLCRLGISRHKDYRRDDGAGAFAFELAEQLTRRRDSQGIDRLVAVCLLTYWNEDLSWLDWFLRRQGGNHYAPSQRYLWNEALANSGKDLQTLTWTLACAVRAGAKAEATDFSERLRRSPQFASGDHYQRCLIGDAYLLNNDPSSAHVEYQAVIDSSKSKARALMGLSAVLLDKGDLHQARILAQQSAASFREEGRADEADFISLSRSWSEPTKAEEVEVVIFCHVSHKLKKNAHLGAPGIGLVEEAVASARQFLRINGLPITVYYDHRDTPLNDAYFENLKDFCQTNDLRLVKNTNFGLRDQWLDALEKVNSDTVFILEQDHIFLRGCPQWRELRNLFRARPDINYVKLNRRRNIPAGFDHILVETERDKRNGVLLTARFGNSPHLLRMNFYRQFILPIITQRARAVNGNFGAGGIEESINHLLIAMEQSLGTPAMVRLAGLAIWGGHDAPAMTEHRGV